MGHSASAAGEMPGVLAKIEEAAGPDAAIIIARRFGGDRLYVPKVVDSECLLARVVGLDAAVKIAAALGYGEVEIPFGPTAIARRLKAAIARRLKAGDGIAETARNLGLSVRTVRRHARRLSL